MTGYGQAKVLIEYVNSHYGILKGSWERGGAIAGVGLREAP